MAGVLTMTPLAPLVLPFLSEHEHGGSGDLILAVDGKRVHNREELEKEIAPLRPGDTVYFSILRNDRGLQQVAVRLTEYPDATADSTTAMAR
jgi:VCBS repeat-containing protein